MAEPYGPNTAGVESMLDRLRVLPARQWPSLVAAYHSLDVDKFEDALAAALDKSGERNEWFALRHAATDIAKAAARSYAAETGEAPRTLEYDRTVNAWNGRNEAQFEETL